MIRTIIFLVACVIAASLIAPISTWSIAIGIALLMPVFLFLYQRTSESVYARTAFGLMAFMLVILSRHDLSQPGDVPDFAYNPDTRSTTLATDFIERSKRDRRDVRDADREQWRKELRDRLERMKR